MKRTISLLMALVLLLGLAACGQKPEEEKEWSRSGSFSDENENVLYISWTEDTSAGRRKEPNRDGMCGRPWMKPWPALSCPRRVAACTAL